MACKIKLVCVRFLSVLAAVFCSISVYAQSSFSVKVKLTDNATGEAVGFATVSLVPEGAEKASKYVLSNSEGIAEIKGVRKGSYTLKAEIMGYVTAEHKFKTDAKAVIDLGELKIKPDVQVLDAASVSAQGNPIIIKKDTVEYNASSFKTSDNDMLEELLKKLPGVEVESDGTITANGETVKKITIDGKTFFLDDPQLATKNIPAKIVEKLKVVDKKSDQAEFTGIDDGERETVIDLSIKPGMMNGWFGNVSAGGGHDIPDKNYYNPKNQWLEDGWRYQGGAMVGRFTKESQISVILNANNSNNRGFNDISGGMMQGMRSGGMGRGSGGWGSGNGITTSWMGGLNGNFSLFDGDMDLGGNYLYNGSSRVVEESSVKTTYKDDGTSLIYNNGVFDGNGNVITPNRSITNSQGHRFGIRLEHKFSENTSIIFEPRVNFGTGNFSEYSRFNTFNRTDEGDFKVNDGYNSNSGANKNWNTEGFLLFRQRIGKPGRTFSAMLRYDFSGNTLYGMNQSLTQRYDQETGLPLPADEIEDIVNQTYDQQSSSASASARVVYTEPLGKNFFLEANYQFSWNRNKSVKNTFNSGSNSLDADGNLIYSSENQTTNENFSNEVINRYINQTAGVSVSYQKEKLRAQLGASLRPTDTHNETYTFEEGTKVMTPYNNKVLNWSPEANLRYDVNDNTNIRFFYWGRSGQPSTSQLLPVPDNSDPLNVSFGNPYLQPYFTHNLRAMTGYTDKQTFFSVRGFVSGGIVQDAITNARWYDSDGAQYSMPMNGPGSGNVNMNLMINSPIAKSDFSVYSGTDFRYNESTTFIGRSEDGKSDMITADYYDPVTGTMDYETFNNDFFAHGEGSRLRSLDDFFTRSRTQTFTFSQRLRFTYRSDLVELTLGGRTRMSKSWYTVQSGNQRPIWNNRIDGSMNWTVPGGINIIASARYNWYNGYTTPQEDDIIINAEITKLLFKDKCTLALRAYDILNQAKNHYVTDESNYHLETQNNTLGRYIIVALTWRFGNFNGNAGMHGGPGRPPHGPRH